VNRTEASLHQLPWDSENFGFPVARLAGDLDDVSLRDGLSRAGQAGFRLVYWPADHGREVPPEVLATFGGLLVDRKATFGTTLGETNPPNLPDGYRVAEYPKGPPSLRMVELSFAAGWSSRFFVDPSFPLDRFQFLYETWIARSTQREMAGTVFAVYAPSDPEPVGMITVSVQAGVGSIGLVAVHADYHGKGLASVLMKAGHRWMGASGATRATVVTQLENAGACGLYRRFGYSILTLQDFYHFWPPPEAAQPASRRLSA
jgi:ribosomal protein S18 acetylase RimI-like enzyme